jgi:ABC-2 type transport system permease protein
MRAIIAVFKREVGLYFRSPIAYAIAFALLLFFGIYFNGYITFINGQAPADPTLIPGLLVFLLFLIGPLLTMRLIAEETREGTLELLMTLPMNESAFIIGKFLAAWFFYTILLAFTLIYYAVLSLVGIPDQGVAFGVYLGAWLYGGAVLAIAMVWSAVTEDQVVAAFLGAVTVLALYLAEIVAIWLSGQAQGTGQSLLADLVRELGLQAHFSTMQLGVIRAEDVLYFIFMIVGALFITTRIVETRRWRA